MVELERGSHRHYRLIPDPPRLPRPVLDHVARLPQLGFAGLGEALPQAGAEELARQLGVREGLEKALLRRQPAERLKVEPVVRPRLGGKGARVAPCEAAAAAVRRSAVARPRSAGVDGVP